MSRNTLFELVNDINTIQYNIEKACFIVNDAYDRVTPTDANKSQQEQAYYALYEQDHIATELGIVLDYMCQVKKELQKVEDTSTFLWKSTAEKEETTNNGNKEET